MGSPGGDAREERTDALRIRRPGGRHPAPGNRGPSPRRGAGQAGPRRLGGAGNASGLPSSRGSATTSGGPRRRTLYVASGTAVILAGLGIGLGVGLNGSAASKPPGPASPTRPDLAPASAAGHLVAAPSPGPVGPEGVPAPKAPVLAPVSSIHPGEVVDGIHCDASEQVIFHVHTHLTIFVDGKARAVPYGIGITPPRQVDQTSVGPFVTGGSCFYWLHTHAQDGIIHIESPVQRRYTLGDFFAIWHQPLTQNQVGPAKGPVTAFYDGKLYRGNPSTMPVGDHVQIQLDVGRPLVTPEHISFPSGL